MKLPIVLLSFSLFSSLIFAQNLVPNPSFETYSSCPNNYNQVSRATGWYPSANNNNPTYHTEYCNSCGTSTFQVPSNTWGNQTAATGVAYMAEVSMAPSVQPNYRENIFAQLTSPLIIGNSYFVSMKVSHTDESQYATNNFGAKFSTLPTFPINNICQVYSPTIITDKTNWTTISGCFIADSAYEYICLGNFFTDANTLVQQSCPSCQFSLYGYYVDDISVTSVSTNILGNTSICTGDNSTLTASGGISYTWNTGATTSSIVVAPTSTTSYNVNIVNGSCNTNPSITVTVTSSVNASISGNTTICSGQTSTLTASGSGNYVWSTGATTSSILVSPTTNTTYSVTSSVGSCTDNASATVSVFSPPTTIVSGSAASICNGNSTILTASSGNQYLWSTGATSSSIIVYPNANATYSATVTNSNGCSYTGSMIVYVTTTTANISGNTTICYGNSSTLNASGGTTYLWNNGATTSTIIVTPNTINSYSAIVSNGNCSDTASISITVNPLPTIAALGSTTICSGDTTTLQCTGTASIYSWAPSITVSPSTGTLVNAFPQGSTTYTVSGADINGCVNMATVIVTVTQSPSVSISGNTVICIGDSTTLTALGGVSYSWSNGSTASAITVSPTSPTTYSVITSNGACSSSALTIVTPSSPPVATASSATICSGQSTILSATGGGAYLWSNGSTNSIITVSPDSTSNYFVLVSIGSCIDTGNAVVTVNPSPVAIAGNDTIIDIGTSITVVVSGGDSYFWNTGETTNTIIVSPTATTIYSAIVTDANGCTSIDFVTVFIRLDDCSGLQQALFIPNVFTPNDDGENDVLAFFYKNKISCIKKFECAIFSRWGEKIFETVDITDSWDGTFKGKKLNPAVFFYYCKITSIVDEQIIKKGNITILR